MLVCYDMLGLFDTFVAKFVKRYANLGEATREAVRAYVSEVKERTFPGPEHSYT